MVVQLFTLHMHIWNARAGAMNALGLTKMGTQPRLQAWVGLTCDHRPRFLHHLGRFVTDAKTCHRTSFDVVMVHAARAHWRFAHSTKRNWLEGGPVWSSG